MSDDDFDKSMVELDASLATIGPDGGIIVPGLVTIPVTAKRVESPLPVPLPEGVVLTLGEDHIWQAWVVDDNWPVDQIVEDAAGEGATNFHS